MTCRRMSGWAWQQRVADTLATYGTRCHLCGELGAASADHLRPLVHCPHPEPGSTACNNLANLRPAHLRCNIARGDRVISAEHTPTRRWAR